jgi:hypothetical protein
MEDSGRRGYSLSALFVLVTASAVLIGGFAPLVQLAFKGGVDGTALAVALILGLFGGLLIGLILGLLEFRVGMAVPMGAIAGAIIGMAAGLIALLPTSLIATSAVTMIVGSGLVIGVSLLNRRING